MKSDVGIEVLNPDFNGDASALEQVLEAGPDVLNHNVETVPRLYSQVRPGALFERSLDVLKRAKAHHPSIMTKSGLMAGLGETDDELYQVFAELRKAGCDLLTVGQYLAPTKEHYPVAEYIPPERFEAYRAKALEMGFSDAACGPLVRSSYKAGEMFRGCSL